MSDTSIIITIVICETGAKYYFEIPEEDISNEDYKLLDNLISNVEYVDSMNRSYADIVGNYIFHRYYDYAMDDSESHNFEMKAEEPYDDTFQDYHIVTHQLDTKEPLSAEIVARAYKSCSSDKKVKNKLVYKPKVKDIEQELIDIFTINLGDTEDDSGNTEVNNEYIEGYEIEDSSKDIEGDTGDIEIEDSDIN